MNNAQRLFDDLSSLRQPDEDNTPHQRFTQYVQNVLNVVERLHFDFKEKGNHTRDDLKNLAKAVSGFANSGGGILIWGIDDDGVTEKPVPDVSKFTSDLLQKASQTTEPTVVGIDGFSIPADGGNGSGFAIIYIPESDLPPHRVIAKIDRYQDKYLLRTGSSFVPASHVQLEDMFGRRPRPKLKLNYRLFRHFEPRSTGGTTYIKVILSIENIGRGVAKWTTLRMKENQMFQIHPMGIDGNKGFPLPQVPSSVLPWVFASRGDMVILPEESLEIVPLRKELTIEHDLRHDSLRIDYSLGAEGILTVHNSITITGEELWSVAFPGR